MWLLRFVEALHVPFLTLLCPTAGIDLYGILGAGVMANATIFMTQLVAEAANYTAPGPTLATSSKGLAPGIDVHGRSLRLLAADVF